VAESLLRSDAFSWVQSEKLLQEVKGLWIVDHWERSLKTLDGMVLKGREIFELRELEQVRRMIFRRVTQDLEGSIESLTLILALKDWLESEELREYASHRPDIHPEEIVL
jgi:predicted ABC-class ATPase